MPAWVTTGFEDYQKRLNQEISLDLTAIPAKKRTKSSDVERLTRQEGEAMLAAIHGGDHVIALDVKGKELSTEQLAQRLAQLLQQGDNLALLVGGPEGLAPACSARAVERWSLSKLTLPHPLVRVLLAEQLYRAWSVLKGHPYHRS